jgi:hypothetical protein
MDLLQHFLQDAFFDLNIDFLRGHYNFVVTHNCLVILP